MRPERSTPARQLLHSVLVVLGATALTFLFFAILPIIQAISKLPTADTTLLTVDAAALPPPPDPPPDEPEEPEEEEKPPEMDHEEPPLDLAQLEMALNPGVGGSGWMGSGFGASLDQLTSITQKAGGGLFTLADLDQKPRVIHQVNPVVSRTLRKLGGGKVWVLFVVDQLGRVDNPIVQKSTHREFEAPTLAAVKKWRFEPGKRKGEPVSFRMRLPIAFPDK